MAAGLPDRVDCMRLANEAAVLEREYALGELPRLEDVLAEPTGVLEATFVFGKAHSGRAAATVSVRAAPRLICQRCLQGYEFPVRSASEVEFSSSEADSQSDEEHEMFVAAGGIASLRDLAEEELLLALPIAAACTTPETCGRAPASAADEPAEVRRPFADLRNLLKRT